MKLVLSYSAKFNRVVVVSGLALLFVPAPLSGRVYKYHRIVPVGVDFLRGGGYCGGISVNLESGDFFEGLQARTTPVRQQFRKRSRSVDSFPEELTITVRVTTSPCVGPPDPRQSAGGAQPEFSFDMKFIASLRFEGFWQRGLERRKADLGLFSSGESGRNSFENDTGAGSWDYVLKVSCPGVPLTDSLVIEVFSADNRPVSRFSKKIGVEEK